MQYTGLKDKNGKEIYEGDIVRYRDDWCDSDCNKIDWDKQPYVTDQVVFVETNAHFYLNHIMNNRYWPGEEQQLEVIGNIYENNDLVQKKKV